MQMEQECIAGIGTTQNQSSKGLDTRYRIKSGVSATQDIEDKSGKNLRTKDSNRQVAEADVAFSAILKHARDQEGGEHGHQAPSNQRNQASTPAEERHSKGQAKGGHRGHSRGHVVADVVPLAYAQTEIDQLRWQGPTQAGTQRAQGQWGFASFDGLGGSGLATAAFGSRVIMQSSAGHSARNFVQWRSLVKQTRGRASTIDMRDSQRQGRADGSLEYSPLPTYSGTACLSSSSIWPSGSFEKLTLLACAESSMPVFSPSAMSGSKLQSVIKILAKFSICTCHKFLSRRHCISLALSVVQLLRCCDLHRLSLKWPSFDSGQPPNALQHVRLHNVFLSG